MTITTLHPLRDARSASTARPFPPPERGVRSSPGPEPGEEAIDGDGGLPRVDLCGLDYYARRRCLFAALSALEPGEEVQLVSDRADDVSWLRYEMEARIPRRYCWSLPQERPGIARIIVRLPLQREKSEE